MKIKNKKDKAFMVLGLVVMLIGGSSTFVHVINF